MLNGNRMPFISITRLGLRSLRFVPGFALHTRASLRQVRVASGFLDGAVLTDRSLTFWTMTAWDSQLVRRAWVHRRPAIAQGREGDAMDLPLVHQ